MIPRTTLLPEMLESRRLFAAGFEMSNLCSNASVHSNFIDRALVNPHGMVADQFGIRVADQGTSNSTDYNGHGKTGGPIGHMPGANGAVNAVVTGIVRNLTGLFPMTADGITMFSKYILVSQDGVIIGYNDLVTTNGIVQVDNSANGAVYQGDALAMNDGHPYLYAVDSNNKRVDVFDENYIPATLAGDFTDPNLPAGYAPFNIAVNGDKLYIVYDKTKAGSNDPATGAGSGIIDEFNTDGTFSRRLVTGGTLNAPWGVTWATQAFSWVNKGDMLVADHGDGKINVFSSTGKYRGQLKDHGGKTISVEGLWGITFGNDLNGVRKDRLYLTAGIHKAKDGLYASLKVYGSALPPAKSAAVFSTMKLESDLSAIVG